MSTRIEQSDEFPKKQLFWSQDVAMVTESFIRTALRNGVNLTTRCKPAPL